MGEARVQLEQKQSFFGLDHRLTGRKITNNVYKMYELSPPKDMILYQNRLYRERSLQDDMEQYQFQAMKDYLKASIDEKIVEAEQKKKLPRVHVATKDSMKRIRHHIRNTNLRHRRQREEALLKDRIRQTHQRQNLLYLKQKIEVQKETLCLQNRIHKKRQEQLERRRTEKRHQLLAQGENPYVIDDLMKVQDKLEQNEMRIMHCKALALQKIEREIQLKEQKRHNELIKKRKWDRYWAQKVSEKKRQHYNTYIRPFLAQPNPASRQERWLRAAEKTYGYESTGRAMKNCPDDPHRQSFDHRGSEEQEENDEDDDHQPRKTSKAKGKQIMKHDDSGSSNKSEESSTTKKQVKKISSSVGLDDPGGIKKIMTNGKEIQLGKDQQVRKLSIGDNPSSSMAMKMSTVETLPPRKNRLLSQHSLHGPYDMAMAAGAGDGKLVPVLTFNNGGLHDHSSHNNKNNNKRLGGDGHVDSPIFSWSPKVISFKNFELGKVYKIKVFVTNKSKERVKYYFKNMSEKEEESYQIPANQSPQCSTIVDGTSSSRKLLAPKRSKSLMNRGDSAALEEDRIQDIKNNNSEKMINSRENPLQSVYTTWPLRVSNTSDIDLVSLKKKKKKTKLSDSQSDEFKQKSDEDVTTPRFSTVKVNNEEERANPKFYKLADLIKVEFTIPSPISPGLQHSFLVKFTPKAIGDWSGCLHFTSEMESFDIAVEIRKKIFSPQLQQSSLTFSNTIVQTSVLKRVKIKNVGGLPGYLVAIMETNPPKIFSEMEYYEPKPDMMLNDTQEDKQDSNPRINKLSSVNENNINENLHKQGKKSEKKKKRSSGLESGDMGSNNNSNHHTDDQPKSSFMEDNSTNLKKRLKKKKSLRLPPLVSSRSNHHDNDNSGPQIVVGGSNNKMANVVVKDILDRLISDSTDSVFVCYVEEGQRRIEPGEAISLCVLYRPPFVSNFVTKYDFFFQQEPGPQSMDNNSDTTLTLDVTGTALENPVYVQPLNGDFRICMINQTYQLTVQAFTTSRKGSGKVIAKVPFALRGLVDVYPHEGTIFATHPCQFSVRFSPKKYMLTSPERYREFFDPETNIIDFPIYFNLKFPYKVPSPIKATFMAIVTDSSLIVEPLEIDMGHCINNETVKAELNVYNPTFVPQQVGFLDVPEEILIQPNYGFGNILPDESIKWDILLSVGEKVEGDRVFQMKLQTLAKEEYNIRIKCHARSPIAKLSHNKILFPVTCCGSTATTFIGIKASNKQTRNILLPKFLIDCDPSHKNPLKFLPNCGYLEPGKEIKIMVTFEANVTDEEVKNNYLEVARKQYYEKINSYQRELASINLHMQNDWVYLKYSMLEENSTLNNNLLQPSRVSTLLSIKMSNPQLSAVLQKITLKRPKTQHSQAEGVTTRIESNTDKLQSSSTRSGTANSSDHSKSSRRKVGSSGGSKEKQGISGKQAADSSSNEKKLTKKDGNNRDGASSNNLPLKQQLLAALEKRRASVLAKLEESFVAPDVEHLSSESVEFARAKRDLLRNFAPTSRVYQIPVCIRDPQLGTDVLNLTVKCPVQKLDLILLDNSSVCNFGAVMVGSSACREISLYNVSSTYLKLTVDILNPYGPFVQVNALRNLAPEHVYTLKIRFEPLNIEEYEECIFIYGMESRIAVTLKGSGGKPNIDEERSGKQTSLTNFGKVIEGTADTSSITTTSNNLKIN